MKRTFMLLVLMACTNMLYAIPPLPPLGYRWVLQAEFSDEFDGNRLDKGKWYTHYPGWEGRRPALFEPGAVSQQNGMLLIRSGVLDKPRDGFTMYGGAVVSKSAAHFGYYECKFKASKLNMSTTFWMSNDKVNLKSTDCPKDQYSQELDIQECVGGNPVFDKFINGMNSNTHFRYIKCEGGKENFISKGAGATLQTSVSDDFHTYGAWWKNAEEVAFFADGKFHQSVKFRKDVSEQPFDRPMHINMVTETYDWQPAPSEDELRNDQLNTASYDWIRAYKLVPVNQRVKESETDLDLYENRLELTNVPGSVFEGKALEVEYVYTANENAKLQYTIRELADKKGNDLQAQVLDAYQGYGRGHATIKLEFVPDKAKNYQLEARLVHKRTGKTLSIVTYDLSY
ncbi:family 16 glycosylhydrolase [Pontibacter sp. E15-1]|uniref:family 16 glycosylhydrolase n=1 Tax=Pontibacter sp. E15-1 TaxID=2919918 RepID=UPI001F4F5A45|nr:family 16 glycosylhydrolase [Pontibacter sp. E15-1]MCJ8163293.1 family 16 glycosylhydrolase [Pontibacter sp. E15-1]